MCQRMHVAISNLILYLRNSNTAGKTGSDALLAARRSCGGCFPPSTKDLLSKFCILSSFAIYQNVRAMASLEKMVRTLYQLE